MTCICGCHANFPKCNIFEQKKPENADNMPDRLARSRGGLRVAMPSQLPRFLVVLIIIPLLLTVLIALITLTLSDAFHIDAFKFDIAKCECK